MARPLSFNWRGSPTGRSSAFSSRHGGRWVGAFACIAISTACGQVSRDGPASNEDDVSSWSDLVEFRATACLPRALPVREARAQCVVTVASPDSDNNCGCVEPGLEPLSLGLRELALRQLGAAGYCGAVSAPACADYCVCAVGQMTGSDEKTCQEKPDASGPSGWCYVAPEQGLGSWSQVEQCPAGQQQVVRVLGAWRRPGQVLMLTCDD